MNRKQRSEYQKQQRKLKRYLPENLQPNGTYSRPTLRQLLKMVKMEEEEQRK
jgi:hypothetical protein